MGTTSAPWRVQESLNNGFGPSDLPPDHFLGSESTYRLSGDKDVLAPAPLDPVLEDWLLDLGLGDEVRYKMAAEGITCGSLSLLSHAQLQELGVNKMGDRVKVSTLQTRSGSWPSTL